MFKALGHSFPRCLFLASNLVFFTETINSAFSIDKFCLTGEERVTCRANVNVVILGRFGQIACAAGTANGHFVVAWMNFRLHNQLTSS